MNSTQVFRQFAFLLIYFFLQIVFFRVLVIADLAFCFVYIGFILFLPHETSDFWVILLSFLIGLMVDLFYNTAGVHAAASTAMGYLRGFVVRGIFSNRGGDADIQLSWEGMGTERFIRYLIILVTIHHLLLFFIEVGHVDYLVLTILKTLGSVVYSVVVISFLHRVLQ
ncbi:MAG: hypothetical protein ACK4LB_15400 [Spirosomataceae bacterium]